MFNRAPVGNLCAQELTTKLNNLPLLLEAGILLFQQGHKLGDIPLPTQARPYIFTHVRYLHPGSGQARHPRQQFKIILGVCAVPA